MRKERKSTICNCVALYGEDTEKISFSSWYDYIKNWSIETGGIFDKAGVVGEAFTPKVTNLDKAEKKLTEQGFIGIGSISLYESVPDFKQIIFGWNKIAVASEDKRLLVICFSSKTKTFSNDYLKLLIKQNLPFFNFSYGFTYQREFEKGPELYAFGVGTGIIPKTDKEHIERNNLMLWSNEMIDQKRYLSKRLRDVYLINVLSSRHLDLKIDSISLGTWISQSSENGKLEAFSPNLFFWEVSSENISQIRYKLFSNNLLIHSISSKKSYD